MQIKSKTDTNLKTYNKKTQQCDDLNKNYTDTHVPRTNWFYEWYIVSLSSFFINEFITYYYYFLLSFVLLLFGSVRFVFGCMNVCGSQFAENIINDE